MHVVGEFVGDGVAEDLAGDVGVFGETVNEIDGACPCGMAVGSSRSMIVRPRRVVNRA